MRLLLACAVACCCLSACAPAPYENGRVPTGVPQRADLAVEADTGPLTFVAPADGDVYLRDVPADRIVYQSPVRAGQRLAFDPKTNQATLDYQPIPTTGLRRDATYQLYFKPARP
jgi:hypothetical protein